MAISSDNEDNLKDYNTECVVEEHWKKFPSGEHMKTMIFLISAELSETQRERLITTVANRSVDMKNYTLDEVTERYKELCCKTRTGFIDPLLRNTRNSSRPSIGIRKKFNRNPIGVQ